MGEYQQFYDPYRDDDPPLYPWEHERAAGVPYLCSLLGCLDNAILNDLARSSERTDIFKEEHHMANIKATQVVTGVIRLSYLHAFQPHAMQEGQEPKYSACLLIPKTDTTTLKAIKAAIEAAKQASANLFGGKVPAGLKSPVHDGDGEMPNGGEYGPECKGMYVINASSKQKPGIVNRNNVEIIDSTELYSGCWARVDVNFYAYNTSGNRGIACGLNNIQKIRDDETLGGRARPQDVFDTFEDEEDDDLGL